MIDGLFSNPQSLRPKGHRLILMRQQSCDTLLPHDFPEEKNFMNHFVSSASLNTIT